MAVGANSSLEHTAIEIATDGFVTTSASQEFTPTAACNMAFIWNDSGSAGSVKIKLNDSANSVEIPAGSSFSFNLTDITKITAVDAGIEIQVVFGLS